MSTNTGFVEKTPINNGQKFSDIELGHAETGYKTQQSEAPLTQKSSASDVVYRRWAIGVAWASIFTLLILAIASFVLAAFTHSSAMFGFGFDALLDVGTSIVVVWRFYGSLTTVYSRNREHVANAFLGVLFIAAAISVAVKASVYLSKGTTLQLNPWLYVVAGGGAFTCIILSAIKFYVGHKLNSLAVIADGYSSLACGVTAIGIIVSALVFENISRVDYLDNVVALCVALFLALYGIKLLVVTLMEPDVSSWVKYCCKKVTYDGHALSE